MARIGLLVSWTTLAAGCTDRPLGPPQLVAVDPASGLSTAPTLVEIRGSGFALRIQISYQDSSRSIVDSSFSAWLNDTPLVNVVYVDSETITATVPAGLPTGAAELRLVDPDGRTDTLADAFTVSDPVGTCTNPSPTEICFNGVDDDCDPLTLDTPTCGDGNKECDEGCDDGDTDDCTAGCNSTCTGPAAPNICGDDQARCGEMCDGTDVPDCTALGFALPGAMTCTIGCALDTSGCTCDPVLDLDTDGDGECDALDLDDDDDTCPDAVDIDPLNPPSQAYPSLEVFFVGQDLDRADGEGDLDLSVSDQAVVELLGRSGHTVTFFEPTTGGCNPLHDNQAVFDAALAAGTFAVIFLSESCQTIDVVDGDTVDPTAPTYLNDAPIGLLTTDDAFMDNLFLGDMQGTDAGTSINLVDNSHFITEFLPTVGPVDLLDASHVMGWLSANGNLAPDLVALAEFPTDAQKKSVVMVEAGGALLNSAVAAERRLGLPAFGAEDWNIFGQTLFLRALLWAAGADQTPPLLDADAIAAHCDNCPDVYNPLQTDTDADGLGDACDP